MSKLWGCSNHQGGCDAHNSSNNNGLGSACSSTSLATTSANNNNNNNGNNGNNGNTLTRSLLVHIAGNRATWEHMGMHGALWQVNPERAAYIFADGASSLASASSSSSSSVGGCDSAAESAALADKLSRAMIRRVTLVESNTNIDEVVAVQIDGLPPREFTKNGEGASVFLTGEGRVTQPQELFQMSGNAELGMQWMRQFPRYTTYNLEEIGVMFLTGASYYFVHQEHPVIHFLKANEDQLGIQIFQEPSLEGGWFRIDVDTFVYTVRSLRETVLRNTPSTFNLANLTVRITKPEAQRWLQLCPQLVSSLLSDEVCESNDPELISEARRLGVQRYFDRPLFVTLRLSIEYALPETASAPPAAPSASQLATMSGNPNLPIIMNAANGNNASVTGSHSNNNNNNNIMMHSCSSSSMGPNSVSGGHNNTNNNAHMTMMPNHAAGGGGALNAGGGGGGMRGR